MASNVLPSIERPSPTASSSKSLVAFSTMIGTTIEWYDFFIFGTASALIFGKAFFPTFDPVVGKLLALSTFAVGLFARPIGAVIFGHYGDRLGRKKMLIIGLFLMGIPTALIGLLPTYNSIGILAPVLLVLIRVLQGVAIGGEWGGAVLMAVEHAPSKRGGFFGSLPQAGCPAALILSSGVFALTARMPIDDFNAWGWRIPFLLSIALVGVGIFVRRRVAESPEFSKVKDTGGVVSMPIVKLVRKHWQAVLLGVGAKLGEITLFWLFAVFVLSYTTGKLGLARTDILNATALGAVGMLVLMPLCGILTDRVGKKNLFGAGIVLMIASAIPLFMLLDTGRLGLATVAVVWALGVLYPIMYAPEASLFSDLFPPEVRYTGLSLCGNVGGAIGGGMAPLVATGLLASYGSSVSVGVYLAIVGIVSLLCVFAMKPIYRASNT